jgi:hypothetical protein
MKDEYSIVLEKARSLIMTCLVDSMLLNVFEEPTMASIWKKLVDLYQAKSLVNKLFLWNKLYALRMGDGDSVSKHLNAFNTIVNQLNLVGVKMDEDDCCMTLLCSLPYLWDNLVMGIESTTKKLVLDEVVATLISEEMRLKYFESTREALAVSGSLKEKGKKREKGRSKSRGRCKSPKNYKARCWNWQGWAFQKRL